MSKFNFSIAIVNILSCVFLSCCMRFIQIHTFYTVMTSVIPHCYLIPYYVHMKAAVGRAGQRCKERFACLHEPLITWTWCSRQISPRGWLNTIAFPSSKSQVYAAKHATRQWKLAVWMMVITLTTQAANVSFQEGAVCWAFLMRVQGQEFIYLPSLWLNWWCWRGLFVLSLYVWSI